MQKWPLDIQTGVKLQFRTLKTLRRFLVNDQNLTFKFPLRVLLKFFALISSSHDSRTKIYFVRISSAGISH